MTSTTTAATNGEILDHTNMNTKTYLLGSLNDRVVVVTDDGVKIYSKLNPNKHVEFDANRLVSSQYMFY